jgi:oligopeptide/dipeptide ABC transporter ATP-binding protein
VDRAEMPLLQVENVEVRYRLRAGLLKHRELRAVNGVSFSLRASETLGLVGESGCGKSSLGRAIVRLLEPVAGSIRFDGDEITHLPARDLRPRRKGFQMVFQDPYGSLDPRMTIGQIVGEPLEIHGLGATSSERSDRVRELLKSVGLLPEHFYRYPHEFSGGQRQRIGIARALAVEPKLIVCDEPVSALDVSVRAQIINLLQDLQRQRRIALLFIAHDLAVVEHISHRIMVMYLGYAVEIGPSREVTGKPLHPYTQALLAAVPKLRPTDATRAKVAGDLPSPLNPPPGCPFQTRCPLVRDVCRHEMPPLREVSPEHFAACHALP